MVRAIVSESILGRSEKKKQVNFHIINLFDFADPPHKRIDDYPFGGGFGMVLKPEPIFRAYDKVISELSNDSKLKVIFPTPDGEVLNHEKAMDLAKSENLVFICGHYKGIDQRVRNKLVTDEISIGDYVITGGELASMIILDATVRLIPGVLNSYESAETDSFSETLLDCSYYTRPEIYRKMRVPEILLSGNHKKIEDWKRSNRIKKTKNRRADLLEKYKKLDE
jgi:tRNA (guanine37-N1)-methyltransferase